MTELKPKEVNLITDEQIYVAFISTAKESIIVTDMSNLEDTVYDLEPDVDEVIQEDVGEFVIYAYFPNDEEVYYSFAEYLDE